MFLLVVAYGSPIAGFPIVLFKVNNVDNIAGFGPSLLPFSPRFAKINDADSKRRLSYKGYNRVAVKALG